MVKVEMTDQEVRVVRAALRYIFDEIEDDMMFEKLFGATRWDVEAILERLPEEGNLK
jgi:hypothetical protein